MRVEGPSDHLHIFLKREHWVLFSPMVSGWAVGRTGGGKKFVRAVSQKS